MDGVRRTTQWAPTRGFETSSRGTELIRVRACVQVTQAYRTSQHPRQSASLRQSFLKFFCINCAHILLTLLSWTLNDFDFSIEWNKKLEPSWILRRSVVTTMSSKLGLTRGRCNREKYRNIKSEWERWRRKTDLNDRKEKEKLWNWSLWKTNEQTSVI